MAGARTWLKHLRWVWLVLILAAIVVQFVLHDRPDAVAVVEGIERGFVLLVFGVMGANLAAWTELMLPATVVLLCFVMGLQNAIVTKI